MPALYPRCNTFVVFFQHKALVLFEYNKQCAQVCGFSATRRGSECLERRFDGITHEGCNRLRLRFSNNERRGQ